MSDEISPDARELGVLLREARARAALSQQQLASRLRLKEKIITALEAGRFDLLPAPTYVRGYIRNYAQLVRLDADRLIELYEGKQDQTPPEILPDVEAFKHKDGLESGERLFRLANYLGSFALIIVLITWWQSDNIVVSELGANSLEKANDELPDTTRTPENAAPAQMSEATAPKRVLASDETVSEVSDVIVQRKWPEPAAEETIATIDSEFVDAPEATTVSEAISTFAQGATRSAGTGNLQMELRGDSWIEVYNAYGATLYKRLAQAGETINLNGATPLEIKLGNADAVTLRFNGELFDTSEYTRDNVANLLLE